MSREVKLFWVVIAGGVLGSLGMVISNLIAGKIYPALEGIAAGVIMVTIGIAFVRYQPKDPPA